MPTVREFLLTHRSEIKCVACGNCCPTTRKGSCLSEQGQCLIHPTIVGSEIRDPRCALADPVGVTTSWGVDCKAIRPVITKLGAMTIPPKESGSRFFNFRILTEVLEKEVEK